MWNKIQRIYIGTNLVRPKWHPWADTIAYYPLNSTTTVNDQSGNNRNLTNSWVTFWIYQWVDCASFNGSSYMYRSDSLFIWSADFTVNLWYSRGGEFFNHSNIISIWTANWTNSFIIWGENNTNKIMIWGWTNDRNTGYVPPLNTWINICVTHSNWALNVYVNWSLIYTWTVSYTITSTATNIWSWVQWSSWLKMIWLQSELILENKVRTDAEISNYYNLTKSTYWL